MNLSISEDKKSNIFNDLNFLFFFKIHLPLPLVPPTHTPLCPLGGFAAPTPKPTPVDSHIYVHEYHRIYIYCRKSMVNCLADLLFLLAIPSRVYPFVRSFTHCYVSLRNCCGIFIDEVNASDERIGRDVWARVLN